MKVLERKKIEVIKIVYALKVLGLNWLARLGVILMRNGESTFAF